MNEENNMSDYYEPSGEFPCVSINKEDALEYLNELRESGEVNMLGAGAYLQRDLGLNANEAKQVVLWWIS
jgi:hypothetical protein